MKAIGTNKGSALMLVIISALFLIILTGAAYTYLRSSGETQRWSRDRIQVKLTAESGANLAVHMIMGGEDIPQGTDPEWFLGDDVTWFQLPDPLGKVVVVVDPNVNNGEVLSANSYEVLSLGSINTTEGPLEFGMSTGVMPENVARFSVFMDDPDVSGYYGDGYKFDGPFYANGPVWIYSTSAGFNNDPYFYSLTLTSSYYVAQSTKIQATQPAVSGGGGNLRLQPYDRMLMGEPYFELNADPIPFGSDELDWTSVQTAAENGGLVLSGAEVANRMRMMIRNDTLLVKLSEFSPVTKYWLDTLANPVVWIDMPALGQDVYLRSYGNMRVDGLSMPLTIGTRGNIVVSGNILYENDDPLDPNNDTMLGLLTVNGDVLIARCQEDTLGFPGHWNDGFAIETHLDVEVDAVLLALDGVLEAQTYQWPRSKKAVFLVMGGYMVQTEGYTGTTNWGYDVQVYFDPRLMTMHPPFFPNNGRWHVLWWAEEPLMEIGDMIHSEY
jgi:hypothetical protein